MQTVTRTERFWLKSAQRLHELCHYAKNLYNEAMYIVRQTFFESRKWVRYNDLWGLLKNSENKRELPAQTAQQVLRLVEKSWKSFFRAIKAWVKNKAGFTGQPKLPHYKRKGGLCTLVFTNQQVKLRGGMIRLPKKVGIAVKTRLPDDTRVRGARIVPKGVGYVLEVIYDKPVPEPRTTEPKRVAAIDLGLANLVTIANNIGEDPIVVKGGVVKSVNQFFNKEKARLQSVYDLQERKWGSKLARLTDKRNRKIADHFHKVSRMVVEWCDEHDIDTIVIGHNKGQKTGINIGRRNNQGFVQAPIFRLISLISYKAEERGIVVLEQDEAHTSKCSFLDGESVEHHDSYVGKRVRRGMFRTKTGALINADVNGAYNILKKAIPKAFADGIEGVGLHPVRWSVA
jgi:putative transposase